MSNKGAMTFVWLIERGQPERQVPTVWWSGARRDGGNDWTTDPWQALRFDTKDEAEAQIDREYFGAGGGNEASARAVEHGFTAGGARLAPLDTTGVLWVAALDRVPIEERVAWVKAMADRVAEINLKRASV